MSCRSFLFLQGVASPFFTELGKSLVKAGHKVSRINFYGGDYFFSRPFINKQINHINYRGSLKSLHEFMETLLTKNYFSDIVLFGDTRPIHQAAIDLARMKNITIHVFEEGYLRPYWITLEKDGVNANSRLSKDPQWYKDFSRSNAISEPLETGMQMRPRAWHDIRYHLAGFALKPLFPLYFTHRPDSPLTEYIGWIKRFPRISLFHKKQAEKNIRKLVSEKQVFYVLPLQLNADAQMREHSPIKTVLEVIETTIHSFAKHADNDSLLVIKNHPLDTGLINYQEKIANTLKKYNVDKNRIIYLETGDLNVLLDHAKGTVLVNSTVGMSSLAAKCPTITLGSAIYDIQGLTYQGKLDEFWLDALKPGSTPDDILFSEFRSALITLSQINGDFYTKKGIEMAVQGSMRFLNRDNSHSPRNSLDIQQTTMPPTPKTIK